MDELVDAFKNLTLNKAEYYDSNTATESEAKDDLTSNHETVTHNSNGMYEQKLLSFRTILFLSLPTNPGIATVRLTPQMLLTSATKEIAVDAALGGVWTSKTPWRVSRTGVDGSTSCGIDNYIIIIETSSPDLLRIIGTDPPCGLSLIQEVGDIHQPTYPGLVRQFQKLDATTDGKLSDNRDLTSIFSKVISDKLSNGSRKDLYTRCRMNLTVDSIQTQTTQLLDLGLSTINTLDEGSDLSTPATRIRRPMDGAH